MVLDDLPLSGLDYAASAGSAAEAYVAQALNEIGPELAARRGSKRAAAVLEFDNTLRSLVDQWIQSGRDSGVDEPYKRDICWYSPRYPEPIFRTLTVFWERNPPTVIVGRDGRSAVKRKPPSLNPRYLSREAHKTAIHCFQQLLDSPARYLLSRCDGCGTYFVRRRAPRKDMPIKRGTFCKNCKGLGGARRTVATREQRKKEVIGWAADYWPKWAQTRLHARQSEWIAQQVNRELAKHRWIHDPVTGKWVTQNKKSIEAEVERRNHAEG
jgi:hypothetical protein